MTIQSQRLSVGEKVGYSFGDIATNFFFQSMILYQTRFYTDTVGLSAVAVGTMFLILRLGDAVFDPAIGALADRTRTRWGNFRPWVLWTAVPFGVAFWRGPVGEAHLCIPDLHAGHDALLRQQHALLGHDGRHDR
jgi:GPH family glycoside/pentoside/hexuronide:cation symporter